MHFMIWNHMSMFINSNSGFSSQSVLKLCKASKIDSKMNFKRILKFPNFEYILENDAAF